MGRIHFREYETIAIVSAKLLSRAHMAVVRQLLKLSYGWRAIHSCRVAGYDYNYGGFSVHSDCRVDLHC